MLIVHLAIYISEFSVEGEVGIASTSHKVGHQFNGWYSGNDWEKMCWLYIYIVLILFISERKSNTKVHLILDLQYFSEWKDLSWRTLWNQESGADCVVCSSTHVHVIELKKHVTYNNNSLNS